MGMLLRKEVMDGSDFLNFQVSNGATGNVTAALGVATLDGMGPMCYDGCAETERIDVNSLIPRTLLMAGIIQRLAAVAKS